MPTKKQLLFLMGKMASHIIVCQKEYNSSALELEEKDGKTRLKMLIKTPNEIVSSYLNLLHKE